MIHVFRKGKDITKPTLVLFHGTGGNEQDLLPLAEMLSPDSSVLGIRGNVLENGMPRFFRRLAEGVFDEADLVFRTHEIKQFLDEAAEKYGFDANNLVAVGYSNGANIAGSLLFHYKDIFRAAVLLHPMVPLRNVELPSLEGVSIFIGAGTNDPLITSTETQELEGILQKAGAEVTTHWGNQGHRLSMAEAEAAKDWLQGFSTSQNA
ncbi:MULTISPECIES: alpha/beta hydrolase [Paenibacillus]|jgi:phospholipase/carboxylesterase|uniref:alpha/beta hydrolase n=1 Tax=Paenibacillus TaxID=44249 RepID=UPI00096EF7E4|nr:MULTISPECIES: alpha/beta hydrolase [Paenibacillus]MDH6428840.1 phospholipase/carboxylesterase [Paenibacillus sp. PastH-4]MDH6445042.1 phospholipase/carboxylesterase [Paenibacillus sp. PastF-4]MDH6528935.1 phospholipase/carboxylesterase [Paenibacillus sp. PastH-3]OMD13092.1 carboxylesterase [Paenibacillus odorifer]OMD62626.1 carboxylesterase [Paenibacillus odorifer]